MAGWSIQPQGVLDVLTRVNGEAEELGTALGSLSTNLGAAVTATNSAAISEAVQGYFETVEGPRLTGISTRITASVTGASSATEAYVQGDYEMAATSQREQVDLVNPPRGDRHGLPQ